ncbi:hypothetical protein ACFWPV_09700 [Streptomyces uncialis]|uniref:hypothetical protein n=1 Tax=Streptomyces uncialis TaxID=1048205 RepID=UPI00365BB550
MHDPLTVAFKIRSPWPRPAAYSTQLAARSGIRWRLRRYHAPVIAGRAYRFPTLITVWHRDPSGHDDTTCRTSGRAWRFHIHHWRYQLHPYQQLRRRLLTRCHICGGRSTKARPVNVGTWGRKQDAPWWRGETGLAHRDCALNDRLKAMNASLNRVLRRYLAEPMHAPSSRTGWPFSEDDKPFPPAPPKGEDA